jgi:LysM repeat protein
MTAGSYERRTVKIRRRGRHTTPSQVEKVAAQAGKAAPAVAIAGALVAVPASHASAAAASASTTGTATGGPASTQAATLDSYSAHATANQNRMYTVRGGDSLSSIAGHFYHKPADWQWLAHVNATTITDPNLIYVGQRISVPLDPPANYTLPDYQPRHARPAPVTTTSHASSSGSGSGSSGSSSSGSHGSSGSGTTTDNAGSSSRTYSAPSGAYSCGALETLWEQAGGRSSEAFVAAEIAIAESGGNPNALSPTDDYGHWQINASNGSLATFDPFENARSAIILSDDGANWDAWTTFTSGAYEGRC